MNQIKKVLRKFGIQNATWKDVVKCKLANRNYVNSLKNDTLIRSLNIDWAKFWQEMAHNPTALIYSLPPFDSVNPELQPFTSLDYTFCFHRDEDIYVYENGEKTISKYISQEGKLFVRKKRYDFVYNRNFNPVSMKLKTEWFSTEEDVIFEDIKAITFNKTKQTQRHKNRLALLLQDGIDFLTHNGVSTADILTLENLASTAIYEKGEVELFINLITSDAVKAQTSFLSEELRNQLITILDIRQMDTFVKE